jgi:hypothetical protein
VTTRYPPYFSRRIKYCFRYGTATGHKSRVSILFSLQYRAGLRFRYTGRDNHWDSLHGCWPTSRQCHRGGKRWVQNPDWPQPSDAFWTRFHTAREKKRQRIAIRPTTPTNGPGHVVGSSSSTSITPRVGGAGCADAIISSRAGHSTDTFGRYLQQHQHHTTIGHPCHHGLICCWWSLLLLVVAVGRWYVLVARTSAVWHFDKTRVIFLSNRQQCVRCCCCGCVYERPVPIFENVPTFFRMNHG